MIIALTLISTIFVLFFLAFLKLMIDLNDSDKGMYHD